MISLFITLDYGALGLVAVVLNPTLFVPKEVLSPLVLYRNASELKATLNILLFKVRLLFQ